MKFRYPLATTSWDKAEYDAMKHIISLDRFTMGESVANFESNFAEYIGSRFAVMVNSGSSANLLMTGALFYTKNPDLKLHRGDEIIVPAVSWSTTYYPLCQYGLHLKFVDIDIETLNYDLSELKSAITNRTRAIMAVNLLGNPNDFSAIDDIIGKQNIILIEDNCESMGAKLNRRHTGTFGLMGSFSTFFSHHISTMEGGLVVTNNEELYQIMLALRAHGWTRELPKFNHVTGEKSDDPFEESFRFVLPGYNLRPLEISGALGLEQLKKLPELLNGRRVNAGLVQKQLGNNNKFMIQKEIGESSWFGFSLVLRKDSGLTRPLLIKKLIKAGFECRPIVTGNFTKNSVMQYFDFEINGDLKNAEYIDNNGVYIGNHHYPLDEAIEALTKL